MILSAPQYTILLNKKVLNLSKTAIMAILNVNDDSFYAQSRVSQQDKLKRKVELYIEQGATLLDIGAQSTRPQAQIKSEQEELDALMPALEIVQEVAGDMPLSVDTFRSNVARHALDAGAAMINDVTGGDYDSAMFEVVAQYKVPYCLMHSMGMPDVMQSRTEEYTDLLTDIFDVLFQKKQRLLALGVHDVIVDLGFGFGKSVEQNYALLKHLAYFGTLNSPILVGVSRKSFLSKSTQTNAETNLAATLAAQTLALQSGYCHILRVHDVEECRQLIEVVNRYQQV